MKNTYARKRADFFSVVFLSFCVSCITRDYYPCTFHFVGTDFTCGRDGKKSEVEEKSEEGEGEEEERVADRYSIIFFGRAETEKRPPVLLHPLSLGSGLIVGDSSSGDMGEGLEVMSVEECNSLYLERTEEYLEIHKDVL